MTAIRWAIRVRCDWPGCQSEGDVMLLEQWPDHEPPAGWIEFAPALSVLSADGLRVNEFCSIHATASITAMAKVFGRREVPA